MRSREAITKIQTIAMVIVIVAAGLVGVYVYITMSGPAESRSEITFGVSLSFTGPLSEGATLIHKGLLLAESYVNDELGGVYVSELDERLPLRILAYDDASDSQKIATNTERLISSDNVDVMLGPWSGDAPPAHITEQHEIPYVAIMSWSDIVYTKGYEYIFNLYFTTSIEAQIMTDLFSELNENLVSQGEEPISTVAIAYGDLGYTSAVSESLKPLLEASGLDVVVFEKFAAFETDFTSIMLKMKPADPDLVIQYGLNFQNLQFIKEMKDNGINPRAFYCQHGPDEPGWIESAGADAEGVLTHVHDLAIPWPGMQDEVEWFYTEAAERLIPTWAGDGNAFPHFAAFEAVLLAVDAIERAGTLDKVKVRDAMAASDMMLPGGPVKFGPDGVNTERSMGIVQVQNGEWKLLAPESVQGYGSVSVVSMVYPKPSW